MTDALQHVTSAITRRTALATAGSLGILLTAQRLGQAVAQASSPTPTCAVGVTAEILSRKEADAAPAFYLQVVRITFAPDAIDAPHTHPRDTVTYQESGSHAFTVLAGRPIWCGRGWQRQPPDQPVR